tara:strand:+ start:19 stop:549 length:531 start_codon:yes stop_codon:yes gene_type:complete
MSSQLRVDKILPVDGAPTSGGGGIVQVKSTTKTDTFDTTSTSFTDITGLSVSITPKFSTSKILVTYHVNANMEDSTYVGALRLMRDSTPIFVGDASGSRTQASSYVKNLSGSSTETHDYSGQHLDSPSTTSSVTYKMQGVTLDSGRQLNVNKSYSDSNAASQARTASSITVMEISA